MYFLHTSENRRNNIVLGLQSIRKSGNKYRDTFTRAFEKKATHQRCYANGRVITQIIRTSSVLQWPWCTAGSGDYIPFNVADRNGKRKKCPRFGKFMRLFTTKVLPSVDGFVFPATVAQFSKALTVTRGDVWRPSFGCVQSRTSVSRTHSAAIYDDRRHVNRSKIG